MGLAESPWAKPNENRVKLLGPVCVGYGHPDMAKIHKFLTDFGLVEALRDNSGTSEIVCYRGYGVHPVVYIAKHTPAPEFLGVYFEAESMSDLEKATRIPGAGKIEDFVAGGKVVDVVDPTGMPFHVVFGMEKREYTPPKSDMQPLNFPAASDKDTAAKPRRGEFHRMTKGIIPVHKLGHVGYVAADLDDGIDFYCTNFNFKPSDIMTDPAKKPMLVFCHVDLGQDYSDHHSFFIAGSHGMLTTGNPHHAAFEIENIDKQFIGHEYLQSQGYQPFWGVGRHTEGSQVYDYWFDLDGFLIEHYADGDIVNEDHPITYVYPRNPTDEPNWGPKIMAGAAAIVQE